MKVDMIEIISYAIEVNTPTNNKFLADIDKLASDFWAIMGECSVFQRQYKEEYYALNTLKIIKAAKAVKDSIGNDYLRIKCYQFLIDVTRLCYELDMTRSSKEHTTRLSALESIHN